MRDSIARHGSNPFIFTTAVFGSAALHAWLSYGLLREQAVLLAICWLGLFCLYGILLLGLRTRKDAFPLILGIALLLRLVYGAAEPVLSDDYYRYYYDAELLDEGINPYLLKPSDPDQQHSPITPDMREALLQMNSRDYHSVYPPLLQGFYWLAYKCCLSELAYFPFALRLIWIMFEMGTLLLLSKALAAWHRPASDLAIYALHPLLITEFSGNLHNETLMVFGLALVFYGLSCARAARGTIGISWAIGAKLLPVIVLPAVLLQKNGIRSRQIPLLAILLIVLLGPLMLSPDGYFESLALYFRRFEFNGSVYRLARAAGSVLLGYNPIGILGPLLGLFSLCLCALNWWNWWKSGARTDARIAVPMALCWLSYYLLSTTVHPWYIAGMLVFALFTASRALHWWAFSIFFSYIAYSTEPFHEAVWIALLQYLPLAWLLFQESGRGGTLNPAPADRSPA